MNRAGRLAAAVALLAAGLAGCDGMIDGSPAGVAADGGGTDRGDPSHRGRPASDDAGPDLAAPGDAPAPVDAPLVGTPCPEAYAGFDHWNCVDGQLVRCTGGLLEEQACPAGCEVRPVGQDDTCLPETPVEVDFTVNGNPPGEAERDWIRYIAEQVVPHLEGDRETRLRLAARVTWWALKEGVLDFAAPNPVAFSLCSTGSGDQRIGPLETCAAGRAWQVGLSAVQVPGHTLEALEALATRLFPGQSSDQVLEVTARVATYGPGDPVHDGIVASTGDLRRSWLLRTSAIGFTVQEPTITAECIDDVRSWCFGSGWDTTALYAPTQAAAMQSIADLARILDALAPTP